MSATFRANGATLLHASNSPLTRLTAAPSQRAPATLLMAPKPAPLPNLAPLPAPMPNLAPSNAALATLTERITPIAKSSATPTLFAGSFAGTGAVGGSPSDDTSLDAAPPAAPLQAPAAASSSKLKWIVGGIAVTGVLAAGIAIVLAASSKKKKKRR